MSVSIDFFHHKQAFKNVLDLNIFLYMIFLSTRLFLPENYAYKLAEHCQKGKKKKEVNGDTCYSCATGQPFRWHCLIIYSWYHTKRLG